MSGVSDGPAAETKFAKCRCDQRQEAERDDGQPRRGINDDAGRRRRAVDRRARIDEMCWLCMLAQAGVSQEREAMGATG